MHNKSQQNKSGLLLILLSVMVASLLVCGGIGTALVLPAIQASREVARRQAMTSNLKRIGTALHNYQSAFSVPVPEQQHSTLESLPETAEQLVANLSDRIELDDALVQVRDTSIEDVTMDSPDRGVVTLRSRVTLDQADNHWIVEAVFRLQDDRWELDGWSSSEGPEYLDDALEAVELWINSAHLPPSRSARGPG